MMKLLLTALFTHSILGHSWLECSEYDPISFDHLTLGDFDRARCSGYPRGFARQFSEGFGVDTGFNWGHTSCATAFNPADYTTDIPMATYSPGDTIYLSHPAKNHVADTCTNQFIPSTSFVVKMSSEVGVDTFDITLPLVGGDHVNGQIDFLGFQRCFNFCSNVDKAHCLSAWTLPETISEGRHSFIWTWEFNENEFYSNCFDAIITSGGSNVSSPQTPSSAEGSSSMSSDASGEVDITIPDPTPAQSTFAPTPASTTSMPVPTPTQTTSTPTAEVSESPVSTPENTVEPEVISTSSGSKAMSPFLNFGSYLLNITGSIDLSGLLNLNILAPDL